MPKETIEDGVGAYRVRVGWQVDRDVQIGIETAQGHSLISQLYGDAETLAAFGAALATNRQDRTGDVLTPEINARRVLDALESSATSYTGIWAVFDRESCNRTIRALRRARDSAYGRDE